MTLWVLTLGQIELGGGHSAPGADVRPSPGGGPCTGAAQSARPVMDFRDLRRTLLYIRYGAEPEAFTRILERIVSNWPRLGRPAGCLDITVHAHVFGRPMGAIEFLNSLELVKRYGE